VPGQGDITGLLAKWREGDADAGAEVVSRTYGELRRIAHAYVRRERKGLSIPPTALLNEAYLRLLHNGPGNVEDREAFFRLMAAEMRRRLVDHARRRLAAKRGGAVVHAQLDDAVTAASPPTESVEPMLTKLDQAMEQLTTTYPRGGQVVELRFMGGLTTEETAAAMGLSTGTVKRDWTFARAWLAAAVADKTAPSR
jgi:RNA polymerase sigma factor (TIGR02999 family)